MGLNTAPAGRRRIGALRRRLSARGAAAGLVALASLGLTALAPGTASAVGLGSAWSFKTQPTLQPPKVTVDTNLKGAAPGLIFTDPFKDFASATPQVGQSGAMIVDSRGNPVWFKPAAKNDTVLNFNRQMLNGAPVLTYWQGLLVVPGDGLTNVPPGYTEPGAVDKIYNQHYQLIKTVKAQGQWTAIDPREFLITPRNTAYYITDKVLTNQNLTSYGGRSGGSLEDNGIQEVDLNTGKVLFDWDMTKHVSPGQSVSSAAAPGVWDPYHINSIAVGPHGDLLISVRNTWSLYEINRRTGALNWTLDSKPNPTDSSFTLGSNAGFSFQHDARFLPSGDISMFDDHCCKIGPIPTPAPVSRQLVLRVSTTAKTANYVSSIAHLPSLAVETQGNAQPLSNGNTFVGWGQQPYYSEYSSTGKLLYDATLPAADESYRTYRQTWTGKPLVRPRIRVRRNGRRATIHVSWNGTTQTTAWELLVGTRKHQLVPVEKVAKRGFETTIRVRARGAYYRVKALDANGHVLRASAIARAAAPGAQAGATTSLETYKTSNLGAILAASNGHTLYEFNRDTRHRSSCTGRCARSWKALRAGGKVQVKHGSGLNARLVGTIRLPGGASQVTYHGHPLYEYVKDKRAGDLHGQDLAQFGGNFYAVGPKGRAIVCAPNLLCGY